nr:LysE family transporter [Paracoccus liaowanqingii]
MSTRSVGKTGSLAGGAVSGSFLFFFSLGYGSAWLRPIFAKPSAWRILEAVIAIIMWAIAAKLVLGD